MYGSIARYRENEITQAAPGDLLIKLLDVAHRNTSLAIEAVQQGRPAEKGVAIGKALNIVGELSAVFDESKAPEVAERIRGLYQFVRDRLLEGSIRMDAKPLEEARQILERLKDIWSEAVAAARKEGVRV